MSELSDDAIIVYHRVFDFSKVRIPFSSFLLSLIKHYKVHFSQLGSLGLCKVVTFEKNGIFFIDLRAILDYKSWRHPDLAINDPKPLDDSYNQEDVWKSQTCDSVLRGADRNVIEATFLLYPPAVADAVISDPTLEDLVVGTLSTKVLAKVDSLKKRKSLLSRDASSHVANGNQSGALLHPSLKVPMLKGKAIMTNAVVAPTGIVGCSRSGATPAASCRDVIAGKFVDQFPTPGEMVRIKALTDDQLNAKMSVLHYLMMSHSGGILARYMILLKSHHDYVQSIDYRLKNLKGRCASFLGLKSQISSFQKQVVDLNGKLSISDVAFSKSKFNGKNERKRPSLVWKFLSSDEFSKVQGELLFVAASASFEHGFRMYRTPEEFSLEPKNLAHQTNVFATIDTRTSPLVMKESTVVPVSSLLKLPFKAAPSSYAAAPE
ncbi:hypothetical protein Tco_0603493 [Tanacetum coccineum]